MTTAVTTGKEWFGHPRGLFFLFFTEMWERFSYYGMRAILVYYMTKELLFSQEWSSQVYGLYTGLVYLTPFFGGIIADRYIGQKKSVTIGGILMAIGLFLLMAKSLFYVGLFFLILGNGAFKPNISTQVGSLYPDGDSRRDGAFSIFYMGINLGAFFSPLICGTLGEVYGWHWGFFSAGIGMLLGLLLYMYGQKHLAQDNVSKKRANDEAAEKIAMSIPEKRRIMALGVLCFLNILFWANYEQQGNTLALWADTNTDRIMFGWEMPASWFQSFNPAMIFIFTPIITWFWSLQAKRGKELSSVAKMSVGCILLGLSFLIMIPAARSYGADGQLASPLWLTSLIFVATIGELYLSPVGLSLVTKLAPKRMVSMLMGMWFLSSFFGNYLSGFIGTFWEKMSKEQFFIMLAILSISAGIAMLLIMKPLKRAMQTEDC